MRIGLFLLMLLALLVPQTAAHADTELCNWGETTVSGGYLVAPNRWNSSGDLCVTTTGGTDFTVNRSTITWGNHNGGGPGAYPNIGTSNTHPGLPLQVSAMGDTTTSWDTTLPGTGAYNAAYDIWYSPGASTCPSVVTNASSVEIMVWLSSPGVDPDPSWKIAGDLTVGGRTYDVFKFTGPTGQVALIYDMKTAVSKVNRLNLRLITQDAVLRGLLGHNAYLCKIQAGFEVSDGGTGLKTNAFSVELKQGVPTGMLASGLAGKCVDNYHGDDVAGNKVTSWRCNPGAAQRWTLANDGTIRPQNGANCLTANGTANASKITLAAFTGAGGQKWQPRGNNSLLNPASGKCLDVPGSNTANNVQLQIYTCNASNAQKWSVPYQPVDAQRVTGAFTSALDNRCLDFNLWSGLDQAGIYPCNGTAPQTFTIANTDALIAAGRCLTATAGKAYNKACVAADRSQMWVVAPGGNLVWYGYDQASPLIVKYLSNPGGADNTQLLLADCANTAGQTWYAPV
ncbi:ricin-type beta-trefoil lectin domain protein [Nonomuraea sp. NPDC050556]|uniref:ricin-type beta-trefoil lectin domain protein n=1 Tax=Nonomuraea sp. NPDC050556 TaxID=3364369 RepID=UPI0037A61774